MYANLYNQLIDAGILYTAYAAMIIVARVTDENYEKSFDG